MPSLSSTAAAGDARLRAVYEAYSARDVEQLLTCVTDEVDWPDGDRRLHGKDELRGYWTRQWMRSRTRDVPTVIAALADDVRVVHVDQTVRAPSGDVVSRGAFVHVLHLDGPLISRLDIVPLRPARTPPAPAPETTAP